MRTDNLKTALAGILVIAGTLANLAEGQDTLGAPGISIEPGTHVLAAGTGLHSQPGTIGLNVPAGVTIKQVLLYWSGAHRVSTPPDDTIVVNGISVTGTLIGFGENNPAPVNPELGDIRYVSFRADITDNNLVAAGANVLTVTGLDNSFVNDGAGVLVIVDNGSELAHIDIRDGLDWAYWKSATETFTDPQTFSFPAAPVARVGVVTLFVGSVDQQRPNRIEITVNGETTTLVDPLFSNDGDQWDTYRLEVPIPAGATSFTIELISTPVDNELGGGASLGWVTAAFAIRDRPVGPCLGVRTQGYWKNHPGAWPIESIDLGGVTLSMAEAISVMQGAPAGDKTYNLAEQLIAAKLNVEVGNESSCVSQAIADAEDFLAEHAIGSGVSARSAAWKGIASAFETLVKYNEGRLCAPHTECDDKVQKPDDDRGFTKVEKRGKKLNLAWKIGKLECADDPNGPWTPVLDAPASGAEMPLTGARKFYRLRR